MPDLPSNQSVQDSQGAQQGPLASSQQAQSNPGNQEGPVASDVSALTFGMKAVGLTFNPSGNPEVNACKQAFAGIIDRLNQLRTDATSGEAKRYYSTAITYAEISQMEAVKAITWQY